MKTTPGSRTIAMILFFGCMLFFNWPLVSITGEGVGTVIYLFFFWAIVIAGLWLHCRSLRKLGEGEGDEGS
ncbi:MAG: hypothetical protein V2B20_24370 [Pseudomonadota bacterium]